MEFISKDSKHYAEAIRLFGLKWVDNNLSRLTDADVETAASAARGWLFDDLLPEHWFKRQMLTWWREHVEARPSDSVEAMRRAIKEHARVEPPDHESLYWDGDLLRADDFHQLKCPECGSWVHSLATAAGIKCQNCLNRQRQTTD